MGGRQKKEQGCLPLEVAEAHAEAHAEAIDS